MEKEKHILHTKTTQLIEKEDLLVTRVFWFMFGFLSASVLILIFFTSVCIPFLK